MGDIAKAAYWSNHTVKNRKQPIDHSSLIAMHQKYASKGFIIANSRRSAGYGNAIRFGISAKRKMEYVWGITHSHGRAIASVRQYLIEAVINAWPLSSTPKYCGICDVASLTQPSHQPSSLAQSTNRSSKPQHHHVSVPRSLVSSISSLSSSSSASKGKRKSDAPKAEKAKFSQRAAPNSTEKAKHSQPSKKEHLTSTLPSTTTTATTLSSLPYGYNGASIESNGSIADIIVSYLPLPDHPSYLSRQLGRQWNDIEHRATVAARIHRRKSIVTAVRRRSSKAPAAEEYKWPAPSPLSVTGQYYGRAILPSKKKKKGGPAIESPSVATKSARPSTECSSTQSTKTIITPSSSSSSSSSVHGNNQYRRIQRAIARANWYMSRHYHTASNTPARDIQQIVDDTVNAWSETGRYQKHGYSGHNRVYVAPIPKD
jgi:hypothetical protein